LIFIETGWGPIPIQLITRKIEVKVTVPIEIQQSKSDSIAIGFVAMMAGKGFRKPTLKENAMFCRRAT
tara:strand:- start:162 stop:365 length:204 start_codon:yes stop_codon:yes gene_type:complete